MKCYLLKFHSNYRFLVLLFLLNILFSLSSIKLSSRSSQEMNENYDEIFADYISSNLSNLLHSKTISLNRYKVTVSAEDIKLSFYPFTMEKSIRFSDLIIFKNNEIFLNKITSIKKYIPEKDSIKRRQLSMIMHLLQKRYSDLMNCRLFFNKISKDNHFSHINRNPISGQIHNQVFNIMCFTCPDEALKFEEVFKLSYKNYLKSKANNLAFNEVPCPDKKLIKVEYSISEKNKEKAEQQWNKGYINTLKDRIVVHEDKSNSNVLFHFKSFDIKDCLFDLEFNHNKKSICFRSKLIHKKEVRSLITICPIRSTETQALIDYKYLVNSIGNNCVENFKKKFEEIFVNMDNSCELISFFKGHSEKFIESKLSEFVNKKISLLKENNSDNVLKTNLQMFFKTMCKRFINNFLENNKNKEIKDFASKIIKNISIKKQSKKKVLNKSNKKRCKKRKSTNQEEGYRGCNRTLCGDNNIVMKVPVINNTIPTPKKQVNVRKNCTCIKKNNQSISLNKTSNNAIRDKKNIQSNSLNKTGNVTVSGKINSSKVIKNKKYNESISKEPNKFTSKTNNKTLSIPKKNNTISSSSSSSNKLTKPKSTSSEKESEETCKKDRVDDENENRDSNENDNDNVNSKQENSIYKLYRSYFDNLKKSIKKRKKSKIKKYSQKNKNKPENSMKRLAKKYKEAQQNKTQQNIFLFKSNLPTNIKKDKSNSKAIDSCSKTKSSSSGNKKQVRKRIQQECNKNDIYCLCKNHPQYKDCVCLAYPKSVVCLKNYCVEHCDEYECNPSRCDEDENEECDKCYCKDNMNDIKCKCKTNPYSEECFCLQYPLSHLCNKRSCQFNPNSLFCACRTNLRDDLCTPRYCVDNSRDAYCKCITNPMSGECKCLNDPRSCSKSEFIEAIVEYDLKIRDSCSNNKLFYTVNPYDSKNSSSNYIIKDPSIDITLIDPMIIYNMYYPHCDKKNNPYSSSSKDEPCIPFPPPPQPCKKTENPKKLSLSSNTNNKSCLKFSPDGICILSNNKIYKQSKLINSIFSFNKNKNNLINLKKLEGIKNDKQLVILYNKLLLFNSDKSNDTSS